MTPTPDAIARIRSMQPDPGRFIRHGRGFVDWKFSQVCAYLGYEKGRAYAEAMRRWHDYRDRYEGCNLDKSFQDFLEAENSTHPVPV